MYFTRAIEVLKDVYFNFINYNMKTKKRRFLNILIYLRVDYGKIQKLIS